MRLRHDPEAMIKLRKSKILIEEFPYKVKKTDVIELGMGKGEMIVKLAEQNPDITYIGVEKYATVAVRAAKQAVKLGLTNFFIICDDITHLDNILKGKVNTMWLTFSDPWPKVRHAKRRLTYKTYLDKYKKILSRTGVLKMKTDNDKLFEYSVESFQDNKWKLKNVTRDLHSHKANETNVMTGYEEKWTAKGKNINYLEAYK